MGNLACMWDMRNAYKILVGKPKTTNHLGDQETDGRILKYILKKQGVRV